MSIDYKIFSKLVGDKAKANDVIVFPTSNPIAKYNLIFFSGDVQVCINIDARCIYNEN